MFSLVDVTGLTRSQIAAKQLAHNAIEGQDNEQLLAEIYRQIEDADSKLEAFVDQKLDVEIPRVKIEGLDVEIDFKTVLLIFLPRVKERLDRALEYLRSSGQRLDGVYIAADSDYAPLERAVRKINEEYDVRVVADIIGKMADLALEACGASVEGPERVHLKDILGTACPGGGIGHPGCGSAMVWRHGQANRWQALGTGPRSTYSNERRRETRLDRLAGESSRLTTASALPGHGCKPVAEADGRHPRLHRQSVASSTAGRQAALGGKVPAIMTTGISASGATGEERRRCQAPRQNVCQGRTSSSAWKNCWPRFRR
jgi:hypothetical protein